MRVFVYEHVTAGGLGRDVPESLLREGRAMLEAVSGDFRRLPDIEFVTAPHSQFRETAARCDWTLVIAPEFDDHLRGLSQTVLDVGGRLLGSQPTAIALTGDKLATAAFWHERGVRHPRTESFDPEYFASFPPPWVMKPRCGAGSLATFLIQWGQAFQPVHFGADADRLESLSPREFVIQEYERGQPASVALLIGPRQTIPLMPARQHLSQDGRFRYQGGSLPLPPDLAERATALALAAVAGIDGLQGYLGVDLVLGKNGDDYAIEINSRLTTSYIGLRQLCRGNLAELMLQCVRSEGMEPPQWNREEVRFGEAQG